MPVFWQYAYEGEAVCNLQGMATMYKPCGSIVISQVHILFISANLSGFQSVKSLLMWNKNQSPQRGAADASAIATSSQRGPISQKAEEADILIVGDSTIKDITGNMLLPGGDG